jgi:hypothetical protein
MKSKVRKEPEALEIFRGSGRDLHARSIGTAAITEKHVDGELAALQAEAVLPISPDRLPKSIDVDMQRLRASHGGAIAPHVVLVTRVKRAPAVSSPMKMAGANAKVPRDLIELRHRSKNSEGRGMPEVGRLVYLGVFLLNTMIVRHAFVLYGMLVACANGRVEMTLDSAGQRPAPRRDPRLSIAEIISPSCRD